MAKIGNKFQFSCWVGTKKSRLATWHGMCNSSRQMVHVANISSIACGWRDHRFIHNIEMFLIFIRVYVWCMCLCAIKDHHRRCECDQTSYFSVWQRLKNQYRNRTAFGNIIIIKTRLNTHSLTHGMEVNQNYVFRTATTYWVHAPVHSISHVLVMVATIYEYIGNIPSNISHSMRYNSPP